MSDNGGYAGLTPSPSDANSCDSPVNSPLPTSTPQDSSAHSVRRPSNARGELCHSCFLPAWTVTLGSLRLCLEELYIIAWSVSLLVFPPVLLLFPSDMAPARDGHHPTYTPPRQACAAD
ncbi:predicted protein [Plenodomus lingam JN3]|uniref:Predicted protein n=1 Tax=Leptosphaeria maculans (strain JN3 / isolate v23.1.3 / race Av1-4-5-6-7-8) TaxID=985895 RepID=E5AEK2_LEPMJ|nr:predicted protein [Plenodomus lingam JN3]CBY01641.1 predicted protein [Plenodomus lingam JN3]